MLSATITPVGAGMASYRKRGKTWRVEVYRDGVRESASFPTKQQAAAWAQQREAGLDGTRLPDKTLADALDRFRLEVSPTRKGARWEELRLRAFAALPMARKPVSRITAADIAAWRDGRLTQVAPATVAREMAILRTVLETARKEWRCLWITAVRRNCIYLCA